jgi:hypothetical protein
MMPRGWRNAPPHRATLSWCRSSTSRRRLNTSSANIVNRGDTIQFTDAATPRVRCSSCAEGTPSPANAGTSVCLAKPRSARNTRSQACSTATSASVRIEVENSFRSSGKPPTDAGEIFVPRKFAAA